MNSVAATIENHLKEQLQEDSKRIKCRLCSEFFLDSWEHAGKHQNDIENYHGWWGKDGVCLLCGGGVSTIPQGEDGWITDCNKCHMIWDED
mgnify:CR=1 FL=1